MSTMERKRMSSKESNGWIYDIIPIRQINELEENARILERNFENGVNIVLISNHDNAIRLCRAFKDGLRGHNMEAWIHTMDFLASLISAIELHLEEEGIDPYEKGIDPYEQ